MIQPEFGLQANAFYSKPKLTSGTDYADRILTPVLAKAMEVLAVARPSTTQGVKDTIKAVVRQDTATVGAPPSTTAASAGPAEYFAQHVDPMVTPLCTKAVVEQPSDVVEFIVEFVEAWEPPVPAPAEEAEKKATEVETEVDTATATESKEESTAPAITSSSASESPGTSSNFTRGVLLHGEYVVLAIRTAPGIDGVAVEAYDPVTSLSDSLTIPWDSPGVGSKGSSASDQHGLLKHLKVSQTVSSLTLTYQEDC